MNKINKLTGVLATAVALTGTSAYGVDLGESNGTKVQIGGYVKAEAIFNQPEGADNTFEGTMRQSRFNIKTTKMVEGKKLTSFIEGDFYGGNASGSTYDYRMRHAYIGIDNLTIGQTWNGQFFAIAPFDGEMINFFGLGAGTIAGNGGRIRRDLNVHYTMDGYRFSAQDPVYADAGLPDLVGSYSKRFKSGDAYNVAVTARDVQNGTDSDLGVGVSFIGKLAMGSGSLHGSIYTGKGMGVYSGLCVGSTWNPGVEATCDAEGGDLVSQTGFSVSYKHKFDDKLRGTVRYGKVTVDDNAETDFDMTNMNLIYKYLPGLDVGVEFRTQSAASTPVRPEGQQIEIMALYKF